MLPTVTGLGAPTAETTKAVGCWPKPKSRLVMFDDTTTDLFCAG